MNAIRRIPGVFGFGGFAGAALLLVACAAALTQGRYPVGVADFCRFLAASMGLAEMPVSQQALLHNLIFEIRLPRVLSAVLVGASLSASGSSYQAVFRNPLVSPSLLGVLAGASAGSALGIVLGLGWFPMQCLAFAGGVLAVLVAVFLAQAFGRGSVVLLVLGGVVSAALFSSVLTFLKYVADPQNQLPAIVYWLMGSLTQANLHDLSWMSIPLGGGILGLCLLGRAMDALSMGDDEARALGVPARGVRIAVIALATLVCALTVSLAGMIGWIGLVVPHVARLLVGPRNARLVPASALLGGCFLLLADGLSRNLFATELPIGVVTEWIGIPAFVMVLGRARKGWLS